MGWIWTAAYIAIVVCLHRELANYVTTYLSVGHPIVAMWIAIGLGGWLFFRLHERPTILEMFFLMMVLAPSLSQAVHVFLMALVQRGSPLWIWILPTIPALLHLLITPDWGGLRRQR